MVIKYLNMKRYILFLILPIFAFYACEKFEDDKLEFDVTATHVEVNVGEPVIFNITGNAEQISFYSGENGHNYDFKDVLETDDIKKVLFSFRSHYPAVGRTIEQDVLISSNFSGNYNYNDVLEAKWDTITNRFSFGPYGPWTNLYGPNWTKSGIVDISEYILNQPYFYLAHRVKYEGGNHLTGGNSGRTFRLDSYSLVGELSNGEYVKMASSARDMGFTFVHKYINSHQGVMDNSATKLESTTLLRLDYYSAASEYFKMDNDLWAISKYFSNTHKYGSGKTIPIKGYTDIPINSYSHYYQHPGNYKVVFIGSTINSKNKKSVTKEINVTVREL